MTVLLTCRVQHEHTRMCYKAMTDDDAVQWILGEHYRQVDYFVKQIEQLKARVSALEFTLLTPESRPSKTSFAQVAMQDISEELKRGCGLCYDCLNQPSLGLRNPASSRMIVCVNCGNKRCPQAENHNYQCANSNEPNQEKILKEV